MERRSSKTPERLEVALHEAADALGEGNVARLDKWMRFHLRALGSLEQNFDELLKEFGIPQDMADIARTIAKARRPDVQRYAIRQAASISKSQVVDFDYSVRMVLTSSKLHGEMYPTLLLKLRLREGEEVLVEMNREQLDQLLAEFEKIDKVVASIETEEGASAIVQN